MFFFFYILYILLFRSEKVLSLVFVGKQQILCTKDVRIASRGRLVANRKNGTNEWFFIALKSTNATAFGPFLSRSLAYSVHCECFIMIREPNKCIGLAAFFPLSLHSEMRQNFLLPLIFHPLHLSFSFLFFFGRKLRSFKI